MTTLPPVCGNGSVENGEQCDDGNTASGDGCSATCQLESGFTCPTPGMPCTVLLYCGDGILTPPETCDDGIHVLTIPGDEAAPASARIRARLVMPAPPPAKPA